MSLKQVPEETSSVNMLIYLLLRYPQIIFINYNLAKNLFCISFMLKEKLETKRYIEFRKNFSDCLVTFKEIVGAIHSTVIKRKIVDGRTLLQITWKNHNISIEEVNLVSSLVLKEFHKELIIETRKENYIHRNNDEGEYEYLQSRKKDEENLFAFREAGRVYVFDK